MENISFQTCPFRDQEVTIHGDLWNAIASSIAHRLFQHPTANTETTISSTALKAYHFVHSQNGSFVQSGYQVDAATVLPLLTKSIQHCLRRLQTPRTKLEYAQQLLHAVQQQHRQQQEQQQQNTTNNDNCLQCLDTPLYKNETNQERQLRLSVRSRLWAVHVADGCVVQATLQLCKVYIAQSQTKERDGNHPLLLPPSYFPTPPMTESVQKLLETWTSTQKRQLANGLVKHSIGRWSLITKLVEGKSRYSVTKLGQQLAEMHSLHKFDPPSPPLLRLLLVGGEKNE